MTGVYKKQKKTKNKSLVRKTNFYVMKTNKTAVVLVMVSALENKTTTTTKKRKMLEVHL